MDDQLRRDVVALCNSVETLFAAVNRLAASNEDIEESGDDPTTEQIAENEAAMEAHSEAWRALEHDVHDVRKRLPAE